MEKKGQSQSKGCQCVLVVRRKTLEIRACSGEDEILFRTDESRKKMELVTCRRNGFGSMPFFRSNLPRHIQLSGASPMSGLAPETRTSKSQEVNKNHWKCIPGSPPK